MQGSVINLKVPNKQTTKFTSAKFAQTTLCMKKANSVDPHELDDSDEVAYY